MCCRVLCNGVPNVDVCSIVSSALWRHQGKQATREILIQSELISTCSHYLSFDNLTLVCGLWSTRLYSAYIVLFNIKQGLVQTAVNTREKLWQTGRLSLVSWWASSLIYMHLKVLCQDVSQTLFNIRLKIVLWRTQHKYFLSFIFWYSLNTFFFSDWCVCLCCCLCTQRRTYRWPFIVFPQVWEWEHSHLISLIVYQRISEENKWQQSTQLLKCQSRRCLNLELPCKHFTKSPDNLDL